ncbi:hypothetical protein COOONC_28282 [Cooperia oncophora]
MRFFLVFCSDSIYYEQAQYVCAELAASGCRLSYCVDPDGGKSSPYVSTADIPSHLVDTINGMTNGHVIISARDVWAFLNDALKRYRDCSLWPEQSGGEEEMFGKAVPNETGEPPAPLFKVEVDADEQPLVKIEPGSAKGPMIKAEPISGGDISMAEERVEPLIKAEPISGGDISVAEERVEPLIKAEPISGGDISMAEERVECGDEHSVLRAEVL